MSRLLTTALSIFISMSWIGIATAQLSTTEFERFVKESLCTASNSTGNLTRAATEKVVVETPGNPQGFIGRGHGKWHDKFYRNLKRNDTKTSCCNLADCRPTSMRIIDDSYEVMVDGVWVRVPFDKINPVTAPDLGPHVCAPVQQGTNKGILYCVVLPPET